MKRQIVLDTETTGFDAEGADRIIEIGAVEIINYLPTGKFYHQYINPERNIPDEAVRVHGITDDKVKDEPVFAQTVEDFLNFIGDSELVIHNAEFDMRFINAELKRVGMPALPMKRAVDTLLIAREKFPGSPANLDALCRRFNVDNSNRTFHGALLDAQLLAEVYLELAGGRQHGLSLSEENKKTAGAGRAENNGNAEKIKREPRHFPLSEEDKEKHAAFVSQFKNALWIKKEEQSVQ